MITNFYLEFEVPSDPKIVCSCVDQDKLQLIKEYIIKTLKSYNLIFDQIDIEEQTKDKYVVAEMSAEGILEEKEMVDFKKKIIKFLMSLFKLEIFHGEFLIGDDYHLKIGEYVR